MSFNDAGKSYPIPSPSLKFKIWICSNITGYDINLSEYIHYGETSLAHLQHTIRSYKFFSDALAFFMSVTSMIYSSPYWKVTATNDIGNGRYIMVELNESADWSSIIHG